MLTAWSLAQTLLSDLVVWLRIKASNLKCRGKGLTSVQVHCINFEIKSIDSPGFVVLIFQLTSEYQN